MQLVVTYFDRDGSARFWPLVQQWLDRAPQSGCTWARLVLTDVTSRVPDGVAVVRANPARYAAVVREAGVAGSAFDYKGALIAAALMEKLLGAALVCDADAMVHRDPAPWLADVRAMAMPPDAGARRLVVRDQRLVEHSSGVLWFPDAARGPEIATAYVTAWQDLARERRDQQGLQSRLREQRAWSVTWSRLGGVLLPREMGWSPHWWGENPDLVIRHAHGDHKWQASGSADVAAPA